jgi:high-affinity Fe2+/Pb2+ permease
MSEVKKLVVGYQVLWQTLVGVGAAVGASCIIGGAVLIKKYSSGNNKGKFLSLTSDFLLIYFSPAVIKIRDT